MLRVGVVGCGPIGLRHARSYQSHPDARLTCVCDVAKERADSLFRSVRTPDQARAAARKLGFQVPTYRHVIGERAY
ncbi:MAG: Gfo/Idh/MocA family oxidoreductase, partial [Chloroflexi bacterium]|nr:Gfo/Idh/MocA family oxidoreductase [Chloroflexota bacterium]